MTPHRKNLNRIKLILVIFLSIIGTVLLAWGWWPLPQKSQTITATGPAISMMDEAQRQAAGEVHSWRITAQWPPYVRTGESTRVSLAVETLPATGVAVDESQYHLEVEARCDLAGMQHSPQGNIQTALIPGQPRHFYWRVDAGQPGSERGVLWLYLDFVPVPGSLAKSWLSLPLSAQEITLQSVSLAGLAVSQARLFGVIALLSGLTLLAVRV